MTRDIRMGDMVTLKTPKHLSPDTTYIETECGWMQIHRLMEVDATAICPTDTQDGWVIHFFSFGEAQVSVDFIR